MIARATGRTSRSLISSIELADVEDQVGARFFGLIRHMRLTSMWTLFPSFVLKVISSGTGRSPSSGLAFISRFCWEMGSVVQRLTNGMTK